MVNVVGIQLQKNGKIYYFDSNQLVLKPGDFVIADTSRGQDLGEVMIGMRDVEEDSLPSPLKKIIRVATEQDIRRGAENRQKEKEAFQVCQKKIAEHQLDMKLVSVEYAFDASKILFYFTANGRVDFRSLVKDLASVFKMRIELRQIGVRDEAKMLGGLGPCGRPICCGAFLSEFQPVSIKMAKEQNLSLNPTKISGVCGRLMCCLKYEQDHYEQTRKKMPKTGREVNTPDGIGTVSELNIVKETVSVRITNGDSSEIRVYPLESITFPVDGNSAARPKAAPARRQPPDEAPAEAASCAVENAEMTSPADAPAEKAQAGAPAPAAPRNENGRRDNRKEKERSQSGPDSRLGKPVRRENPNRPKNDAAASPAPAREIPASEKPVKEKPAAPKKPSGSWADAVERAMNSIGE
ncbi:MAG: hypothetical protein K6E17_04500 [Clostridiales bacterium]|nr:hypothetical protein [Clostridiales bacterium]